MRICGDCQEELKKLVPNSVHSIVTDPPAGIGFMGKEWDEDKGGKEKWINWLAEIFTEARRVIKPGGHGLVWALPRTSHWTAQALEEAGFEIRDCIYHVFGSGFPKSLNVGKAIGKEWEGWGTALKPAVECWWLIRKPLSEKSVANNVIKWGVGGINIDACRIESGTEHMRGKVGEKIEETDWKNKTGFGKEFQATDSPLGRFPSHLIHDGSEEVLNEFSKAGESKSSGGRIGNKGSLLNMCGKEYSKGNPGKGDIGTPARFFYCAKASKAERNKGCEELPLVESGVMDDDNYQWRDDVPNGRSTKKPMSRNNHPTVKPIKLMEYLVRLITPPGGTVLDMFMGSGTTGIACKNQGFNFIGIEKDPEYFKIAEARLK